MTSWSPSRRVIALCIIGSHVLLLPLLEDFGASETAISKLGLSSRLQLYELYQGAALVVMLHLLLQCLLVLGVKCALLARFV